MNRINKGITVNDIIKGCRNAKMAGLEPHLTIMVGYPWQTREDAWNTFRLAKYLFEKGWADTLQVTVVIPYPGTRLFEEAKENGWLKTLDWDDYDIIYQLFLTPRYAVRKATSIKSLDDLRYALRGLERVLGHIRDFSVRKGS